jgi:hypothetical protein
VSHNTAHLISTLSDFVNVCDEGGFQYDDRPVGDIYPGLARADEGVWFIAWFIDVFVQDLEHKSRIMGAVRAIDAFATDVSRWHYKETGEPLRIPPKIIDELKRRVLTGYFPGVDEIVREAKHGQPLRAQQALLRTFQEDAWRMRSE